MKEPRFGLVLWFTGLPSSGKSTLARSLEESFDQAGVPVQVLDSDELRTWLTPDPDYTELERDWFYEAVLEITRMLSTNGVNVLIAATASKRSYRDSARAFFPHFVEVYVQCPPDVCRQRDVKGLWNRSEQGELEHLPGAGSRYEVPLDPEIAVDTSDKSLEASAQFIIKRLTELNMVSK